MVAVTAYLGVRIGPKATARAVTVDGHGPRLEIDSSDGETVTIFTTYGETTTAGDVAFARALYEAADEFLTECARRCGRRARSA